jgi:hypothetical protein
MRAEYDLDYSRSKPNRFSRRMPREVVVVVLEPDVASAVKSPAKVNAMLRSAIAARPPRKRAARVGGHRRKVG